MVALRAICHEAAMALLEEVAKEAAKVAICEMRQCAVAQMYMDNATAKEDRMADATEVAATWDLIDSDEIEVEDNDDDDNGMEEKSKAELHAARHPSVPQRLIMMCS
jgi:hypothetical protein